MSVKFEGTFFGRVTVGKKAFHHDVYVDPDGNLAPREGGHRVSADEIRTILKSNPEVIVIGTGQFGCVKLLEEAARVAEAHGVKVVKERTPVAIKKFNELVDEGKRIAAIVHVTC